MALLARDMDRAGMVKIANPGMIQVRMVEDIETDQMIYNFSVTFQTTIAVDLTAFECDGTKARAAAIEAGVELLEQEIGRHVNAG